MENKILKVGIGTLLIAAAGVFIYRRSKQKLQVLKKREESNVKVLEGAGYKVDEIDGTVTNINTGNVAESKDFVRELYLEVVYDDNASFCEDCVNTDLASDSEHVVHIRQTEVDGINYLDLLFTVPESAYVDGGSRFRDGDVDVRNFVSNILGRFDQSQNERVGGIYKDLKDKYFSNWKNINLQADLDGYLLITFEELNGDGNWEECSAMIRVESDLEHYKQLREQNPDKSKNEILTMFMKDVKSIDYVLESANENIRNIQVQDSMLVCRLSYPMFKDNEQCGITVDIAKSILLDLMDEEDGLEVFGRGGHSFKYDYLKFYPHNYDRLVYLDREYDENAGRKKVVLVDELG